MDLWMYHINSVVANWLTELCVCDNGVVFSRKGYPYFVFVVPTRRKFFWEIL